MWLTYIYIYTHTHDGTVNLYDGVRRQVRLWRGVDCTFQRLLARMCYVYYLWHNLHLRWSKQWRKSSYHHLVLVWQNVERSRPHLMRVGLRHFACGVCGFKSRRARGCLFLVSVVFCPVEVSETSRPLLRRSLTERGVSECNLETSAVR